MRRTHATDYRPSLTSSTIATGEPDLRDHLALLRRRLRLIVAVIVLVVLSALTVSYLQTPIYEAGAEVLLQPRASERLFDPSSDRAATVADASRVETEIQVMRSRSVGDAVADELGDPASVTIAAKGETDVVTVQAESADPAQAADIANTYARTYIEVRRQQLVADLLAAAEQVQEKVDEFDTQIRAIDERLAALDAQVAAATSEPEKELLSAQRDRSIREIDVQRLSLLSQRSDYTQQLDQLQLAGNLTQTGGAQVVSEAEDPDAPVRPEPVRNGVLALAVGIMAAVGLAYLLEYLDDTVKDKDGFQAATGVAVLGLIPTVPGWKDRGRPQLVSMGEPTSPAAEAYRSLRTSVQFIGLDRPLRVLQLTSPAASEGKTTTVANLGVAMARAGMRVVVVDCDLRRPRLHEFFGVSNALGFTSVLLGDIFIEDAVWEVPVEPRLSLLTSGLPPPNPSELLSSKRTTEVFDSLVAEYDVVLVDSPPVLPVTDALVLAGVADAVLLAAVAGSSTTRNTQRAVELLRQVGSPLVGAVLSGVEAEDGYRYDAYPAKQQAPAPRTRNGRVRGADVVNAGASSRRPAV